MLTGRNEKLMYLKQKVSEMQHVFMNEYEGDVHTHAHVYLRQKRTLSFTVYQRVFIFCQIGGLVVVV